MPTVYGQVKLIGRYADRVEKEAAEKRVSKTALIAEYALRGIEAVDSGKDSEWASLERRLSATLLSMRGEVEAVQAGLDTLTAMFDLFVKLMLLHLPEPLLDEAEAIQSSALTRYERFLKQVATTGFDQDRPQALRKIARLLETRIQEVTDES
ncbi:hypothetical protein HFQ13_08510 [Acidithiobacillus sp. VAN18-1]|uniref:Uncharacterized protein n=1 Tax=Igneacidithiobacillus copahuensis TaxID=2724909 RepID=A0AAE2YQS4_9PROT|nr:hypothetical protein [Igneacidithiobacillus copahuensis]MBU2788243.1 hypothetical protein [Igneacidithiobacillus copahuensis]MBU2797119.1 hypothetical protein [Acidithiobacillus sp. VAN18-2]